MATNIPLTTGIALNQTRAQIRANLELAVKSLSTDPSLGQSTSSTAEIERVGWVQEIGDQAISNLDAFWKDLKFYSRERIPSYIQVALVQPGQSTLEHYTSLEAFSEWLQTQATSSNQNNTLICAIAEQIQPPAPISFSKIVTNLPSVGSVCTSAAVACLLLAKDKFGLNLHDLFDLLATLTRRDVNLLKIPLSDINKDELFPSEIQTQYLAKNPTSHANWYSLGTQSVVATSQHQTSTTTLIFPDQLPEIKSSWRYVDIFQPHAKPPTSNMRCSVWGAQATNPSPGGWNSVVTISNDGMAKEFVRIIEDVQLYAPGEIFNSTVPGWHPFLRFLYVLGINNSRLLVRDAMKTLYKTKYDNIGETNSAAVNICLTYMEHLKYQQELVTDLRANIATFPEPWNVTQTPSWVEPCRDVCKALEKELSIAHQEAVKMRSLMIEQHDLSKSRLSAVLTLLASIFIPMAFVASLLGMNTKEINDSSWPSWYYIAIAGPLTLVTLAIPLYGLQIFNFFTRVFQTRSVVRRSIRWGAFGIGLSFLLIGGVTELVKYNSVVSIASKVISIVVCAIGLAGYMFDTLHKIVTGSSAQNRPVLQVSWKSAGVMLVLIACTLCLPLSMMISSFLLGLPYAIYAVWQILLWRKKRR